MPIPQFIMELPKMYKSGDIDELNGDKDIMMKAGLTKQNIPNVFFLSDKIRDTYAEVANIQERAKDYMDSIDGLSLPGGLDIEKEFFDENFAPDTESVDGPYHPEPDYYRTMLEFALLSEQQKQGKPALNICRGCQITNVFMGGTIDYTPGHLKTRQVLRASPTSSGVLSGIAAKPFGAISCHSYSIGKLADGLEKTIELDEQTSIAAKGRLRGTRIPILTTVKSTKSIKAAESKYGGLLMLTQFHPEFHEKEDLLDKVTGEGNKSILQALVDASTASAIKKTVLSELKSLGPNPMARLRKVGPPKERSHAHDMLPLAESMHGDIARQQTTVISSQTAITKDKFRSIIQSLTKAIKREKKGNITIDSTNVASGQSTIVINKNGAKYETHIEHNVATGSESGAVKQTLTASSSDGSKVPPDLDQMFLALIIQKKVSLEVNINECTNPTTIINAIKIANSIGMIPKITDPAVELTLRKHCIAIDKNMEEILTATLTEEEKRGLSSAHPQMESEFTKTSGDISFSARIKTPTPAASCPPGRRRGGKPTRTH